MNPASIQALLVMALSLLNGARSGSASLAAQQQAVTFASQAVQISTQALASINFSVPTSTSIYPNFDQLTVAPYIRAAGGWTKLGSDVQLISEDTSFGDLNGDGHDDAAVIVKRTLPSGGSDFALAIMLNQNGILFNITDTPLGNVPQIFSHRIDNQEVVLEMQNENLARTTVRYSLLGTALIKKQ